MAEVVGNAIVQLNMYHTAHDEDGHLISHLHVLGFFRGRERNQPKEILLKNNSIKSNTTTSKIYSCKQRTANTQANLLLKENVPQKN